MSGSTLPSLDRERFEDAGYAIIRGFFLPSELKALIDELEEVGRYVIGPHFHAGDDADCAMSPEQQSLLYDRLHYLMALSHLEGNPRVRALCKAVGIELPSLMGSSNMRMDRPSDSRHLFDWHQDTLYLLGSKNAVTLWIPLGDVNLTNGTIQVIAGSHKRGIAPFRRISDKQPLKYVPLLQRDLAIDCEITEDPTTIEASRGDVVVFKQMLLHRSTPNLSRKIRWTVQLRISDLGDPDHRRQGFPTGDKTNIFFVEYPGYTPQGAPST